MHTVWLKSRGDLGECPVCIDEISNPDNPNFRQVDPLRGSVEYSIPCEIHGDPRVCLPGNIEAFDVWRRLVLDDIFSYTLREDGKKQYNERNLDWPVSLKICEYMGIADVLMTMDKLSTINRTWKYYG